MINEWIRFDQPGKYRLYIVMGRVGMGKPYHSGARRSPVSNMVEFEVLPADKSGATGTRRHAEGWIPASRPTD
jgi:hypothetical protein